MTAIASKHKYKQVKTVLKLVALCLLRAFQFNLSIATGKTIEDGTLSEGSVKKYFLSFFQGSKRTFATSLKHKK